MKRKYKKIGIIVAVLLIVIVILTFVANTIIEQKIVTAIDNLPKSVKIDYSDIDASVWSGNLKIIAPEITITGKTTNKTILDTKLKTLQVNNAGYWDYLLNDKISVETLVINNLVAKYLHNPLVKNDDYKSGFLDKIKQKINVDKIEITKADILVTNYDTDSTLLSMPKFNVELNGLQIHPKASKENKRITYNDFTFNAENLKWAINNYDDVLADSVHITNKDATFRGFKLKTKYSKAEFSSILKKERDYFNLNIKTIKILDMDFGFNAAKKFYFNSKKVTLNSPNAVIYRDKLVADDDSYKPLYGTKLRDLDFKLGLNTIEVVDGKLSYLEKVKPDEKAGRLDFTHMNAVISKLGNTYGNAQTRIDVNSTFMKNSHLEVNWNFKVADTTDQFVFKANLGRMQADQMNQFTKPNLNVDFIGKLKQTYFTIDGNPRTSRIDLKVKYDDFKISILKKNGKEKNKFLSTIVNLFVSKDSDDEKKNYRYGQTDDVERDVDKSVFNFVWLNIKGGLLSAIAGDGKKEAK